MQSNQKPTKDVQNSATKQQTDKSCPICLEVFDSDTCRETFTTCGRSFCETCLQQTLKIKPFCPLCRRCQDQRFEQTQLDESTPWNPDVVRAFFGEERIDEEGRRMRSVRLSDGQATNIHVGRGVKINISPNSNLIINGKRVQNPSDCNQQ